MKLYRHHTIGHGMSFHVLYACLLCIAFMMGSPPNTLAESRYNPLRQAADPIDINRITSGMLMDVVNTGGRLVAVGERGHIIFSDDNAGSWTQAAVPVSVTLTAVYFPTAKNGWAVGYGGVILHTTDGGETWSKQIGGVIVPEMIVASIDERIHTLRSDLSGNESDDEDIYYQIDDLQFFREEWMEYVNGKGSPPLMDVWFKDETNGFAVGAFGLILQTKDGGINWRFVSGGIDNPDRFHYYGISQAGRYLFLAGEAGMLFRSTDWGQTWTRLETPYEGSFFGVVASPSGNPLLAYGLRGSVVRSTDMGEQWLLLDKSITGSGSFSGGSTVSNGTIFLVGPTGYIYLMTGNGHIKRLPEQFPEAVTLVEASPGRLVCVGLRGVKIINYNGFGG